MVTTAAASVCGYTLTGLVTATPPLDVIDEELHSAVRVKQHLLII